MSLSSETTNSGAYANQTGNSLELFVEQKLIEKGYSRFPNHKKQLFENRRSVGGKQYSTQVPAGTTIYETKRNVDFLMLHSEKFPDGLIIECKWQQSKGSVDEKYPFLYFNIMKTGVPTIVLLDGDGYKPSAKKWLQQQADKTKPLIGVYSMSEFQKLVNQGFLD